MAANAILIVGESGSGKTTSLENLDPKETFIINVSSKKLPFRNWKDKYSLFTRENPNGNLYNTDNADTIVTTLKHISDKMPQIKYVVVDDSQYVVVNEYMRRAKEAGFAKFADFALNMFKIPKSTQELRDDLFVFFLSHSDKDQDAEGSSFNRAKTIGKMINSTVTYEGMFNIVLFTYKEDTKTGIEYGFITNGDPRSTAKSPKGMLPVKIPNDLSIVVEAIKKYEQG